jgi:hypothetical protein
MGVQKIAIAGGIRIWPEGFAAVRRRLTRPPVAPAGPGGMRTISPYLLAIAALAVGLALAAASLSSGLVQRWFDADVQARSRLIYRSIDASLERAVAARDWPRIEELARTASALENRA